MVLINCSVPSVNNRSNLKTNIRSVAILSLTSFFKLYFHFLKMTKLGKRKSIGGKRNWMHMNIIIILGFNLCVACKCIN